MPGGAPSREDKLEEVLWNLEGEWVHVREINHRLTESSRDFKNVRSLGLFLRRFKFKKKDSTYYIEGKKIKEGMKLCRKWKEFRERDKYEYTR